MIARHSVFVLHLAVWASLAAGIALAGEDTNVYREGEKVRVYGNKIGPLHNAFETYDLFRAPGCPPASWEQRAPTLGQALVGDEFYELNVSVNYGVNVKLGVICQFVPSEEELARWREMILAGYAYQLLVDELPLWAAFGKVINTAPMIYTHRAFHLGTNGPRLVNVTLETAGPEELRAGKKYVFTYSTHFTASSINFEDRFAKYMDEELIGPQIRWFAIANSLLLAMFLVIVVLVILSRVIRTDYQRIEHELRLRDEGTDELVDSTGWKQLYADIHRVPSYTSLLCALIGTGVQLSVVFVFGVAFAAYFSMRRISLQHAVTVVAMLYALTGVVAGCVSSVQFLRYATLSPALSKKWMRCMEFTMSVFPLFLVLCGAITNIVAHIYESALAVHLGGVTLIVALLLIGYCPSVVAGTLLGRYGYRRHVLIPRSHRNLPHVNQIPRLIPPPPNFLLSTKVFVFLCGLMPFGSIAFELGLVLNSLWLNKLYYFYTFLLLTFAVFVIVTSCVSITATYVLLNIENHHWPWMSFGFGASSGFYVYLYSIYFYVYRTTMSGLFTLVFYLVYAATLSAAIGLMGGAIAFLTASLFVKKMYAFVKSD
ncbi:putative endomembrane protein [Trypanosoma rangeli]|uniref:Transmembrane 9 superfamily member n=1 Tax=Trypanosoma rangeli TaxID=5698 RepID=A0A422P482_TRYRA|nr:putative endomembrane protein [Trypanosoma rangeli]RNF12526.1 putative endomembrane protein [Trypanosoma rangeli]|eukprot:RNF12526.1 putative endomembrane protein [Trypanosoma rangeli]